MAMFRLIFHLCVVSSCSFTLITAVKMRIYPSDISVNVGEWASITCRVPCELELNGSHTFKWFVGDHRTRSVGHNFEQKTGIKVETETVRECTGRSGEAHHQLRVFASSAERLNRTAVQCAALRKGRAFIDFYSYFAVILVKDELQATTAPPPETIQPSQLNFDPKDISPTHCKPAETVTVYVTPTTIPQILDYNGQ